MEFTVEFYVTDAGRCPVREFLEELKASDAGDFAQCWPVWRNCEVANTIVNRFARRWGKVFLNFAMWAS
jgi:hypothetical protein